jgi:hypothetical protein
MYNKVDSISLSMSKGFQYSLRDSELVLEKNRFRTNVYKFSYSNRLV